MPNPPNRHTVREKRRAVLMVTERERGREGQKEEKEK